MSPYVSRFAVVLIFSVAALHAEEPAPAKADAVATYQLKNRSKFDNVAADTRAPFWPIGWVKRKGAAVTQAAPAAEMPHVRLDEKSFRVTSILIGTGATPSLAVINGRAYGEGEFLRMPKGGSTPPVRVRVQRINDGTVILQNAEQILVASLVRPQLSSKRAEDLVLDPDR